MELSVIISISLATLTLALGYALERAWLESALVIVVGLSWFIAQARGWQRLMTPLAFSALVALAAIGAWRGIGAGWMLSGMVMTLAAWDLVRFERRIREATDIEDAALLRRAHFRRLFSTLSLGLLLGGLALSLRLSLNLGGAILLGLLILFGLGRVVGVLRQQ